MFSRLVPFKSSTIFRPFFQSSKLSDPIKTFQVHKTYPVVSAQEFLSHSEDPTSTVHFNNQNRHKKLGPVYAESFGPDVFAIFIADPKMCRLLLNNEDPHPQHAVPHSWKVYNDMYNVKRGLFFLDGPEWWRLRQKMNPLLMKEAAVIQAASWSVKVTQNMLKELHNELNQSGQSIHEVSHFVRRLHTWSVQSMLASLFGEMFFGEMVRDNFDIPNLVKNVQTMFEASTRLQTISSEEAANSKHPDWVQFKTSADLALKSVSELTKASVSSNQCSGLTLLMKSSGFSDEEICRLATDFIIAAADATSYTVLWCLHLLATHQTEQCKLREELTKASFNSNNLSSKLNYVRWCNKEAMRLYPVAPFITRVLSEPQDVEGYHIPANQLILLSTFSMGRNELFFEDPLKFWPERWQRLSPTKMLGVSGEAAYATLPFGHGIRSCIGKRLAEHQLAACVANIVDNFKLTSFNEDEVELTMRLIGLPDKTIRIGISHW